MPLNKGCSQDAVDANYSRLHKEGYRNPQLSAIVLSTLKKGCGVARDFKGGVKDILRSKAEGRWVDLADLFEGLPSSPAVRGLSFNIPGGMRGTGTSLAAAPPDETKGLAGHAGPPIPLVKCKRCGRAYNKTQGKCRCGGTEA